MLTGSHSKYHGRSAISTLLLCSVLFACSMSAGQRFPQAVLLTDPHKRDASWLVWSPDGEYIAVSYWSSSLNISDLYSAVYIYSVTTKDYRLFLRDEYLTAVQSWSPDSEEILFYSGGGEYSRGIWKARRDGEESPTFLAAGTQSAWSRAGKIAILSMDHGDVMLSVLPSDGRWEESIFPDIGGGVDGLSWSMDSTKVVFSASSGEDGDDYNLYVAALTTQGLSQLTHTGTSHRPAWSPNQDLIVFEKALPNEYEYSLYLTNSEGTCEIAIPGTTGAFSPSWSPDGTRIAFMDLTGRIYVLDLHLVLGGDVLTRGLICPDT